MGNFLQSFRTIPGDADIKTPPILTLKPDEVKIIQTTWKIPNANPIDSAELIFYTFLERYPENQQKFAAFKDKPLNQLKGSPGFRAHSSRIFNVFSSIIDALDKDPEYKEIKTIIADVGKSHQKRRVSKKSLIDLRGVLEEILVESCKLDEQGKAAWSKFLDAFYNVFFECLDGRFNQFF